MREMIWAAPRPRDGVLVERSGFTATAIVGLGQALVSGDIAAALADLSPGAPLLGLGGLAPEGPHALRIARDSALLVTPKPLAFDDGWRAAGYAASRLDDGFAVVVLGGPRVGEVVMQATAVDVAASSASTALQFAGHRCLLVGAAQGVRLHVEAPWREALLDWLARA